MSFSNNQHKSTAKYAKAQHREKMSLMGWVDRSANFCQTGSFLVRSCTSHCKYGQSQVFELLDRIQIIKCLGCVRKVRNSPSMCFYK